jgi:hypothetical protein
VLWILGGNPTTHNPYAFDLVWSSSDLRQTYQRDPNVQHKQPSLFGSLVDQVDPGCAVQGTRSALLVSVIGICVHLERKERSRVQCAGDALLGYSQQSHTCAATWFHGCCVSACESSLSMVRTRCDTLENDSSCATCALWSASGYSWSLECDEHSARVRVRVRIDSSCKILRIMWLIPKCKADRAVVILAPQKHAPNYE